MNVAVIGLGKLGLPWAGVLAQRGHTVVGVDLNEELIANFDQGVVTLQEPKVCQLVRENTIAFSTDAEYAVRASDIVFVVVPTPSLPSGRFSAKYACDAAEEIGRGLKHSDRYVLVVLVSTVMPGDTVNHFVPSIEKTSGKVCGTDFGVCYNPEFIALGSVVNDMLNPDFVLVGESDERAGQLLQDFYITVHISPVVRMSIVSAEVAKISLNCYMTMKISFANLLSEVCGGLKGANVADVSKALGLDSRIGRKYLSSGTAFGGPCFPRDTKAFKAACNGAATGIVNAIEEINNRQHERIANEVATYLESPGIVAVLGLAYKSGTPVVEESASLKLIGHLLNRGNTVIAWDPLVPQCKDLPGEMMAKSLHDCVNRADAVVVMTQSPEFQNLHETTASVIIDPWGYLRNTPPNVKHVRLGVNSG